LYEVLRAVKLQRQKIEWWWPAAGEEELLFNRYSLSFCKMKNFGDGWW
jgi:hypothetical protein